MVSEIVQKTLGRAAQDHIFRLLQHGDAILQTVASSLNLEKSDISTWVCEDIDGEDLLTFQQGGKAQGQSALKFVSSHIEKHFSGGDALFVVENVTALPQDAWLYQPDNPPMFLYNDHVYHFGFLQRASPTLVEETIRTGENVGPPVIGFVSHPSPSLTEKLKQTGPVLLQETEVPLLTQNVTAVLVGAYDGESYLLWTQPGSTL